MNKIGECAHCGQTHKVEKTPKRYKLECQTDYHDWPPMTCAICPGRGMEPLNVREGDVEDDEW